MICLLLLIVLPCQRKCGQSAGPSNPDAGQWIARGLRSSGLYKKQPVKRKTAPGRKMNAASTDAREEDAGGARPDEKKVYDINTTLEIIPPPDNRK
jgi:hypothetical protein